MNEKNRNPRNGRMMKRTVLRDGNRGRNRRGLAAHKPDRLRTKKPKRQTVPGWAPQPVTAYRMRADRA